jgi:hypothetical protein
VNGMVAGSLISCGTCPHEGRRLISGVGQELVGGSNCTPVCSCCFGEVLSSLEDGHDHATRSGRSSVLDVGRPHW